MTVYRDIPLNEFLLKVEMIGLIVLFALTLGVLILYALGACNRINKKENAHMRLLAERAEKDPIAKKQLDRKLRKQENKKKRERSNGFSDAIILAIVLLCFCGCLWGVITRATDYTKKDYIVYEGTVSVKANLRSPTVTLSDGTVLRCKRSWALEMEDEEQVVIAYAKRSDIVVGFQNTAET